VFLIQEAIVMKKAKFSVFGSAFKETSVGAKLLTGAALATVLAACSQPQPVAEAIRPVKSMVVPKAGEGGAGLVSFAGEIKPRIETDLSFRIAGKLTERTAELGAAVKKGQVLAKLDPQDAQLNAAAARANLTAAESEFEFAKAELARYEDLLAKKFVSQGVYDGKLLAFKAAAGKRDAARAQASVSGNQASYATLVADADGVVTAVNAEVGQVVNAGTPVLRVARVGEKDAVINVAEGQVAAVRQTPDAKLMLAANPAKVYSGKVRDIAAAADPATRTYQVKIALADADESVRWGMSASVAFPAMSGVAGAQPAIALPLGALTQKGDKPAVWLVTPENKVTLKEVAVAKYGEAAVHLTSGLKGGETVVVAGVHRLREGQQVKLQN
jgi:membrane fusion protein, multidrug efflux system